MQNMQKYVKNMQSHFQYAKYWHVYSAYFAYMHTPHFADDSEGPSHVEPAAAALIRVCQWLLCTLAYQPTQFKAPSESIMMPSSNLLPARPPDSDSGGWQVVSVMGRPAASGLEARAGRRDHWQRSSWQVETDFQNASCVQLSRSKNATPIASLEIGAKSICLLRISDWPLNRVSMSVEHPTIDDCLGVAICQYHLCTWILPCDLIKTD